MISDDDPFVERHIITGMVVSDDYLQQIRPSWDDRYLIALPARAVASWCWEYFDKYAKAPGREIETIYMQHLQDGLSKDLGGLVEIMLGGLSAEYERGQFNLQYLLDQTRHYFQQRHLRLFTDQIRAELDANRLAEAEQFAVNYQPVAQQDRSAIDPFASPSRIRRAFTEQTNSLVRFPKAFGTYINDQLARDAFVAFMGPEKRGKSFLLIEIAMRAMSTGCNIVFFQAGDMGEKEMLRRIAIWLGKCSDRERYCQDLYLPVVDCALNQTGGCHRAEREGDTAPFLLGANLKSMEYNTLLQAVRNNPDHKPCRNCNDESRQSTVWLQKHPDQSSLSWREAWRKMKAWRKRHCKQFRLCTHANETLTVGKIASLLDTWEKADGFVPDVIVIDYADLLAPDADTARLDYRNQQNKIWQRLRQLSQ